MATTVSYNEIERIVYMPLPIGLADVWLHENIEQAEDEDGNAIWTADEVYFRTAKTEEEIEANFDEIFANGGTGETFDPEPDEGNPNPTSITERVDEIEDLVIQLAIIAIENNDLSLNDIKGSLQDEVRGHIDDDKWIDK
ncbi:MAG: hypothetical protein LUD72_01945 [Bacteroidales bacterium]|nr:hypothetical protein [Bacteroidales bacterium]